MDRGDINTHFYLTSRDNKKENDNTFQPKVSAKQDNEISAVKVILLTSSGIILSIVVLAISLGNGF